jgi:NAD(P)-dependent dehydrogenase (short-subunit alcohol dehydrogenase family)
VNASFDASGETLVVTGGASGIGAAVAHAYAHAGGNVAVLDVTRSHELERVALVSQHAVDVSDRAAVLCAIDDVLERHGRVDALVACAAVQPRAPLTGMDPAVWRHTLAVDLDGVVWAIQAVLPSMRRAGRGAIVVLSSGLGTVGRAGAAAYAAAKAALVPLARSLAAELADERIRVNVLFPGVIDTPQFRAANPSGGEREHWMRTTGVGVPHDVVGPLMFLLSDAATMTGSTLTRDRAYAAGSA